MIFLWIFNCELGYVEIFNVCYRKVYVIIHTEVDILTGHKFFFPFCCFFIFNILSPHHDEIYVFEHIFIFHTRSLLCYSVGVFQPISVYFLIFKFFFYWFWRKSHTQGTPNTFNVCVCFRDVNHFRNTYSGLVLFLWFGFKKET